MLMVKKEASVIASWGAPTWATTAQVCGEAIVYDHEVGTLPGRGGETDLVVSLQQRDDFTPGSDRLCVRREPAEISLGGRLISEDDALCLIEMLRLGVDRLAERNSLPGRELRLR